MNEFTVQAKAVSHGKKIKVTVLCNGEVIGERTSARPYIFALVVKQNQAYAIKTLRSGIAYEQKLLKEYSGRGVEGIHDYPEYVRSYTERLAKSQARLAELEAGPLPEFDKVYVQSFHMGKVPKAPEWVDFVAVVDLRPAVQALGLA